MTNPSEIDAQRRAYAMYSGYESSAFEHGVQLGHAAGAAEVAAFSEKLAAAEANLVANDLRTKMAEDGYDRVCKKLAIAVEAMDRHIAEWGDLAEAAIIRDALAKLRGDAGKGGGE